MLDELKTMATYRAAPQGTDPDACAAEAMIMFSARVSRVDYGNRMFRIEITADVEDGPKGLPERVGRLVAYRLHSPWVEFALEEGDMDHYFDTFDAMSGDACEAIEDLIAVQGRVRKKLARALSYSPPENLVYVDQISVQKEFRGHGLAHSMVEELHDFMVGAPALVFFQAIPFLSSMSSPPETRAWELERATGTKAMARYWLRHEGLGFCQPGPRTHPHMIVGAWDGEALDPMAGRCRFIPLEEVVPAASEDFDEAAWGISLETNVAGAGRSPAKVEIQPEAERDPAREIDIFDLSDAERCRLAAEDMRSDISLSHGEVEQIVSVGIMVYAALREGDTVGAVVLTPKSTDDGKTYFRAIPEDLGPLACAAPPSLLARLTPPPNGLAETWRKECWRYAHEARKSA